ncbi:hypothetical protein RIVM261_071850 [Rivularia sp. IAM M-261]|nr:hypothetical protein RIVM261_071850 [Rivularia sp. IAM M-261]
MKRLHRALLFLSIALIVSISTLLVATAQSRYASSDTAIRTIINMQAIAWNQDNAQAWVKDFSEDADFINIIGTHFNGRVETQKRHAALFSGIFKNSHLEVEVWKVRQLGNKGSVAETVQTLRGYDALPPGIEPTEPGVLKTRMKYVFEKQGRDWKIVSAQNTAIHPKPPI